GYHGLLSSRPGATPPTPRRQRRAGREWGGVMYGQSRGDEHAGNRGPPAAGSRASEPRCRRGARGRRRDRPGSTAGGARGRRAESDVRHLSGGEAQRVSVARALANEPAVLLLDEPTSALDDAAKQDVEILIRRIVGDQELTCLLVTHDQAQAGRLADRVMVLAAGKLERIGATDEVPHAEDRLH